MTVYRIYDVARDEDNAAISGASVSLRRLSGNAELASTTTGSGGEFYFTEAQVGYPGPIKVRITGPDGVVRERTGLSTGQTGTYFHSDLMRAFSVMNNGVVGGYDNELEVTADGLAMEVTVDTGLSFIQGHPVYISVAETLTVSANASGNPRIDIVALSFTGTGETERGKCELVMVEGTPAGSPVAPSLTQTAALWQEELAQVAVANGASAISNGNITDTRTYSTGPLVDGSIETVHIADGAITNAKVATGIDAAKIANGSVSNTEFQYIGGLTSDAQTQLDSKFDAGGGTFTSDITIDDCSILFDAGITSVEVHNLLGVLTIDGEASVLGDLSATGALVTSSTANITGDVTLQSDLVIGTSSGGGAIRLPELSSKPTPTLGAAGGTGGSAGVSIIRGGSDSAGVLRVTAGTSSLTTGVLVSLAFATARASNEYGVFVIGQSNSAGIDLYCANIQTTGFDIRCNTAPSSGATIDIAYFVVDMV